MDVARVFGELGLGVLERGWLSSNNVVFWGTAGRGATVVDTSYSSHADLTLRLLEAQLGGGKVERVVNTHLHSDHCGGNAALESAHGCEVWVPETLVDPVREWDADRLTFVATDQQCPRFGAARGVASGEDLMLGRHRWLAVAVDGHDPHALVFFQPQSRVLISADALWEDRLAIIFPAIDGEDGFSRARQTLDTIEALEPAIVIPGHGAPFAGVASALAASRSRLDRFQADPQAHLRHAARALAMFHLLERQSRPWDEFVGWIAATPVFLRIVAGLGIDIKGAAGFALEVATSLVRSGAVVVGEGDVVSVPAG